MGGRDRTDDRWHPACNIRDEGSVDFGHGFPFPYWIHAVGTATSAGFVVMPHVFVLNAVILAAIAYPLYRLAVRRLVGWKATADTALLCAGLIVCLFELAPIVLLRSEFYPARSIAAPHSDESYFSFRPAVLAAWQGKRACPA